MLEAIYCKALGYTFFAASLHVKGTTHRSHFSPSLYVMLSAKMDDVFGQEERKSDYKKFYDSATQ
ncbi:hypothetical protein ANAPC3_01368 [Anaplasma phagocytophilum]|nr:hypothetical protein ANAPC3_01368 [Anaplasma phagocytophilum]